MKIPLNHEAVAFPVTSISPPTTISPVTFISPETLTSSTKIEVILDTRLPRFLKNPSRALISPATVRLPVSP
ncbi:hypothetical protein ES703_69977 [subsurface metagenome]